MYIFPDEPTFEKNLRNISDRAKKIWEQKFNQQTWMKQLIKYFALLNI